MELIHNETRLEEVSMSLTFKDWHKICYFMFMSLLSLSPLVMLCIFCVRVCLDERDWDLEDSKSNYAENTNSTRPSSVQIKENSYITKVYFTLYLPYLAHIFIVNIYIVSICSRS